MSWFPVLLTIHICLAVAMLLPSVVLPFALRRAEGPPSGGTHALMALQGGGTLLIATALAVTGVAMLWLLGPELLGRPWLIAALSLYAINLAVAAVVSRSNLRRMVRIGGQEPGSDATWRRR